VASALCIPHFLANKRYEFQRRAPLRFAVRGLCPGVRHVGMDKLDDLSLLSSSEFKLPSTVTALMVTDHPTFRTRDIPRSVTHFAYIQSVRRRRLHLVRGGELWPAHLTHLHLELNRDIKLASLPPNLSFLHYNRDLAASGLSASDLPASLTTLKTETLGFPFSQLPPHLTTLEAMWPRYSSELCNMPASLTHLALLTMKKYNEQHFTQMDAAVELPPFLRYLRAACSLFPMFRSLPCSLEDVVVIGSWALQPAPEGLACLYRHTSLRTLKLPMIQFNDQLLDVDWPKLRVLNLGDSFNQPLCARNFPSLQVLILGSIYYFEYLHSLDDLPSSLERLVVKRVCRRPLGQLPSSLRVLDLAGYNHPLHHLPRQLQELSLGRDFNQPLDTVTLPSNLVRLDLYLSSFNGPLGHLPDTLTYLRLPACFNQPLDKLPPSLKKLSCYGLQSQFNQPLNHLPDSLTALLLGDSFNQPLDHLPDSLTTLRMGHSFNQPFVCLPRGLTTLWLGDSFNHPLPLAAPASKSSLSPSGHSVAEPRCRVSGAIGSEQKHLPLDSDGDSAFEVIDRRAVEAEMSLPLPLAAPVSPASLPSGSDANDDSKSASNVRVTWPSALRSLQLGKAFNQPLSMPSSLITLHFPPDGAFAQALPAVLPKRLVDLRLPAGYRSLYLSPDVAAGLSAMFS